MVCAKCEKKLDKIVTPDVWKEGARNTSGGKDGGRRVGANMLLEKKKVLKFDPYGSKCKTCGNKVSLNNLYCHGCAYKKGVCGMCGVKILDIKFYKQSNV